MHTLEDKYDVTATIVTYKGSIEDLNKAVSSFLNTALNVRLYIIDNSPTDDLKKQFTDSRIEYIYNNKNVGFGRGHNIAIKKIISTTKYHLVLNPDIYFDVGVLEELLSYMDKNSSVGLVVPKVVYPNGNIQYISKLIPSPLDFFIRRLIPFKKMKNLLTKKFELRFTDYNSIIEAPYLSGCFMIFRIDILAAINGFDENIFMHMEDLDITRRVLNSGYKTIFYPKVTVIHNHEIKNMTNYNTLTIYLKSAFYYFNKWGWFFDKNRNEVNRKTIESINRIIFQNNLEDV